MNEDMSEFLGVFLDEATEQMALLEQDILRLEQEPSPELLQEIFRAAHTLKGSSRAMGFTAMGELTHAMEDVFDKLRHGELHVHGELIDALFVGLDALKAMKEEVAASGTTTLNTETQTARLRAVLVEPASGSPAPAVAAPTPTEAPTPTAEAFQTTLTATTQAALQDARAVGCAVFGLRVRIAADCVMKSVRALMVLQSLAPISSVMATTPNEEELENEEFESEFEVVLATEASAEAIREAASRVTEIEEVRIIPLGGATGADPAKESAPPPPAPKAAASAEERVVDAGPEARGKAPEVVQQIAAEKRGAAPAPVQAQTVRVDVARLDKLLNLVGELVIDRTRIAQLGGKFEQEYGFNELVEHLNETAAHVGRITDELQEEIMKARMLPIENVFSRFPRMVRDLAQKLGKEVNFFVEGKETELDRSVIEVIGDPLIHMLRNSVDHGIELPEDREKAGKPRTGSVWLRARHQENHILIEIEDDGKGIDPERLRASAVSKGLITQEAATRLTDREAIYLIFAAGLSTAKEITDVSGRGVGMDIVKSNLEKLGAHIEIESKVGSGSLFTVKLPLTLAIIRGLLVTVRGCVYALPLVSVVETIRVERESVHTVNHREIILQRGKTLPIVRLRDLFHSEGAATTPAERALQRAEKRASKEAVVGTSQAQPESEMLYVVVVGLGERQVGLVVDTLIGEQEVVIKTLGKFIGDIKGISGATILGDGRVALIMDINGLITIATEEKGKAHAA